MNAILDSMRDYEQIYGNHWVLHELDRRLEYTLKVSKWQNKPCDEHHFLGYDFGNAKTVRGFHQIYMILRGQGKWEEA